MTTESTQQPPEQSPAQPANEQPADFGAFYATLADDHKDLIDTHVQGLTRALKAERDQRAAIEKQLKGVTKSAADNPDLHKRLSEITATLEAERARATFYESAVQAGVKPSAIKLAYMAAQSDGLIDNDRVDFRSLQDTYPELFGGATPPPAPSARTGAGIEGNKPRVVDMNAIIRNGRR